MTIGEQPELPPRYPNSEKESQEHISLFRYLTNTKLDSMRNAMDIIEEAGLTVRPSKFLIILDEVVRLRKLCHAKGIDIGFME